MIVLKMIRELQENTDKQLMIGKQYKKKMSN